MSVIRRSNSVIQNDTGTNAAFAASYTVVALPVGAVAVSFAGNTATVDAGHGFAAGDKVLVWDGTTATFVAEALSSVTATTLVWASATPTIAATDRLCNLGPDTATGTTPAYDASPMVIYSDADAATAISNSLVTTDATGNYGYWTRGDGRNWELIRTSAGVAASVVQGWGGVTGRFNIMDWGAAVDGSTDDNARVTAACLAANGVGGGTVYFPEGDTEITSAGVTVKSNINLRGDGISSKVSTASGSIDIFDCASVSKIQVSNLFLEGNGKDYVLGDEGGDGLQIDSSCDHISVSYCHFEKFENAVRAGAADVIDVSNCTGVEIQGAFVYFLGTTNGNVSHNQFDGTRTVNDATNCYNFVWFSWGGSPSVPAKFCSVAGNQIKETNYEAINFKCSHCTAVGNTITDCGDNTSSNISMASAAGESAQPVEGGTYNTIIGNVMRNPGFSGIGVEIASGSNTLAGHHNVITNNVIHTPGTTGIQLNNDASDNIVSGNSIQDSVGHGITLGATSEMNIIEGNRLENIGTGGSTKYGILHQGGAGNVIRGNYLYKTDDFGIYMNGTSNDTSVVGNTVIDSGSTSSDTVKDGIYDNATSTRTLISGNKCWSEDSTHQRYGISVGANATDCLVINNDCRNNVQSTDGLNLQTGATNTIAYGNKTGNTALPAKASATTITLELEYDVFSITGTTNITSVTASWPGRKIVLICAASGLTISDGSNLVLVGDFVTDTANDTLVLVCDGTNWVEMSRTDVA